MIDPSEIQWQGVSLVIAGFIIAVVCSRLVRVLMDILDAKKMQKQENLQPLLGVVSPNFDKIVQMAKEEEEKKMSQNVNGNDEFRTVVLESDKPVLVDFWAEWCGPCRAVGPIVDAIGEENEGILTVKVDIDSAENADLASEYNIVSIPAMRVFVGGEVKKSITGAKPKPALLADLAEFLD